MWWHDFKKQLMSVLSVCCDDVQICINKQPGIQHMQKVLNVCRHYQDNYDCIQWRRQVLTSSSFFCGGGGWSCDGGRWQRRSMIELFTVLFILLWRCCGIFTRLSSWELGFESHHRHALFSLSKAIYPHCCSRPRCIKGDPVECDGLCLKLPAPLWQCGIGYFIGKECSSGSGKCAL